MKKHLTQQMLPIWGLCIIATSLWVQKSNEDAYHHADMHVKSTQQLEIVVVAREESLQKALKKTPPDYNAEFYVIKSKLTKIEAEQLAIHGNIKLLHQYWIQKHQ